MSPDGPMPVTSSLPWRPLAIFQRETEAQLRLHLKHVVAVCLFLGSAVYYGICLHPGIGGEINAGDSVKFQTLGHSSIMVHEPGYPLVLLLSAALRSLELPLAPWWLMSFSLSAVPGALANALAFLIVHRLTNSLGFGIAAAVLLGSATLMSVQATEAEVYALNLAFILAVTYLLVAFVETRRLPFFLGACAVYALSFGNHLMMIMLLPLFVVLALLHRRSVFRARPIAFIVLFMILGASQYLYLAAVAYNPETAFSEYLPLPPTPIELLHHIAGTNFGDLYGSGLRSWSPLRILGETLHRAHPWISAPVIAAGLIIFLAHSRHWRDTGWRKLSLVLAGALCFAPFVLWYGAQDIKAFHLPVLALLLVGAVGTIGWAIKAYPGFSRIVASVLLAVAAVRAVDTGTTLAARPPKFTNFLPQMTAVMTRAPAGQPIIALDYEHGMAALYYDLLGMLPQNGSYRLFWRLPDDIDRVQTIHGLAVQRVSLIFVEKVKGRRPDMTCETKNLALPSWIKWPVIEFRCTAVGLD